MTLTNYWWLLIWIFVGGFILSQFPRRLELVQGNPEERWSIPAAIMLVVPYIIWTGFRDDSFGDTAVYRYTFLNTPSDFSEWGDYLASIPKDRGFAVIRLVIKSLVGNSDVAFFLIIGAIQILCVCLVFRKYSCDYWLSIFVFVASMDYLSWTWNGIRQFLAIAIIFTAAGFIAKKKFVPAIIIVLLAATIHLSALIMIPGIFIIQGRAWNKRAVVAIVISVIALIFVQQFTGILDFLLEDTQYEGVVSNWESLGDDGANPVRALIYSIPTILSVIGYRWIKTEPDPMIHIAVNASILCTALYIIAIGTSGIFMGRLPGYVSLYATGILLPWEIHNIFEKDTARVIKFVTVVFYVVFFYYQMSVVWHAI